MSGLFALSIFQSVLLAGGQVLLKFGLANMKPFAWSTAFWRSVFFNWQFAASGLSFGLASLLWMYIIKKYPLSMAYPLVSLSYAFGMIAAMAFFHESVGLVKWLGVILIICGCCLTAKQ